MAEIKSRSYGIVPVSIGTNGEHMFLILRAYKNWDFPKGGPDDGEQPIKTAIREFTEETGITSDMIVLKPTKTPFAEVFFGTNHVLYRHIYFIAKINNSNLNTNIIEVDLNNINQIREVQAIKWFSFEETMNHIRSHNTERKKIFKEVSNIIRNMG